MSTTEDQPAIGTPEWARALAPDVHTRGDLEFSRSHVWTDDNGVTHGLIGLGHVEVIFHNPQQVRDLIGHLALLAGEMEAEEKRAPVDEPDPAVACSRCGLTDVPTIIGDDGEPRCYNRKRCAERVERANRAVARAGAL